MRRVGASGGAGNGQEAMGRACERQGACDTDGDAHLRIRSLTERLVEVPLTARLQHHNHVGTFAIRDGAHHPPQNRSAQLLQAQLDEGQDGDQELQQGGHTAFPAFWRVLPVCFATGQAMM